MQRVYCPVLDAALRWRYLTAAVGVGVMIVTVGLVLSGRPGFRFVPALEADVISASMTMPQGSPVETTGEAVARLEAGAARLRQRLLAETGRDHFVHVLAVVGDQPMAARSGGPITPVVGMASSNVGERGDRSSPRRSGARRRWAACARPPRTSSGGSASTPASTR